MPTLVPSAEQSLAISAYGVGALIGALLPGVLGAVLLAVGLGRRRAAKRAALPDQGVYGQPPVAPGWPGAPVQQGVPVQQGAAPWGGAPGWPAPAPPQPKGAGKGLIIAGSVLLGLFVLGGLGRVATSAQQAERTIALPTELGGLTRNDALTEQVRDQFLSDVPDGAEDAQVAAYGTAPQAALVLALTGSFSSPTRELDGFRRGVEESGGGTLGPATEVEPGRFGGEARCWNAVVAQTPTGVCAFADRGSLFTYYDFRQVGIPALADRGRQAREASLRDDD